VGDDSTTIVARTWRLVGRGWNVVVTLGSICLLHSWSTDRGLEHCVVEGRLRQYGPMFCLFESTDGQNGAVNAIVGTLYRLGGHVYSSGVWHAGRRRVGMRCWRTSRISHDIAWPLFWLTAGSRRGSYHHRRCGNLQHPACGNGTR
jgi:hypothetical protein